MPGNAVAPGKNIFEIGLHGVRVRIEGSPAGLGHPFGHTPIHSLSDGGDDIVHHADAFTAFLGHGPPSARVVRLSEGHTNTSDG